jgi:hypothetical protein
MVSGGREGLEMLAKLLRPKVRKLIAVFMSEGAPMSCPKRRLARLRSLFFGKSVW